MGGTTQKEKEATNVQNLLKSYYKDIGNDSGLKSDNLFSNYKTPYDYNSMSKELDTTYNKNIGNVNRIADTSIKQGQGDAASRLASQGITGGSVLNSQVGSVANNVNTQRFNTISDLSARRSGQNLDLMNLENQNSFRNVSADQMQRNQAVQQLLAKYGLLSNTSGQMQSNLGNLNDSTIWDDIFAGLNSLVPIATTIMGMPGIGGSGAATSGGGR